jgi:hypothetical protein
LISDHPEEGGRTHNVGFSGIRAKRPNWTVPVSGTLSTKDGHVEGDPAVATMCRSSRYSGAQQEERSDPAQEWFTER